MYKYCQFRARNIIKLHTIEWNNDWTVLNPCDRKCAGGLETSVRTCPEDDELCPGGHAAASKKEECNTQPCSK